MNRLVKRLTVRSTRLSLVLLILLSIISSVGVGAGTSSPAFALPKPVAQTTIINNSSDVITSTWCAPSSFSCFAVGYDPSTGDAIYGSLSTSSAVWSFTEYQSTGNNSGPSSFTRLNSISCTDASHCIAVGDYFQSASDVISNTYEKNLSLHGFALEYSNGAWTNISIQFSSDSYLHTALNSVACNSGSCFVVGDGSTQSDTSQNTFVVSPIVDQVNFSPHGTVVTPVTIATTGQFGQGIATNIACATTNGSSSCSVLGLQSPDGDLDGANIALSFNPKTVSSSGIQDYTFLPTTLGPSISTTDEVGSAPEALSCPTTTTCVALIDPLNGGNQGTSIDVMTSGNKWSIASTSPSPTNFGATNNLIDALSLTAIDCSTSTLCIVGGDATLNATAGSPANPLLSQIDLSNPTAPTFTPVDFSILPSTANSTLIDETGQTNVSSITCGGVFNCTVFTAFTPTSAQGSSLFESYVGSPPLATPPSISKVSLSNDLSNQGFTITIGGSNLNEVSGIQFGAYSTNSYSVSPDGSSLTVTIPAQSAGTYGLTLDYPGGSVKFNNQETILDPPTITSAQESYQFSNQGFTLTVSGTNLGSVSSVYFGNAVGANLQISNDGTSLTATFPAQKAGSYQISLDYPTGQVARYGTLVTIVDPPGVTSITPTTAIAGTEANIVITGTNLNEVSNLVVAQSTSSTTTAAPNLAYNLPMMKGIAANNPTSSYSVVSPTQIDAVVDFSSPGKYVFELIYPGGMVIGNPGSPFTILSPPTITAIAPTTTTENTQTQVTINGNNLNEVTSITLGSETIPTFTLVSPTTITFEAPVLSSGNYPIVLNFNGGKTSSTSYILQVTQPVVTPSQVEPTTTTVTSPTTTPTTTAPPIPVSAPSHLPTTTTTTAPPIPVSAPSHHPTTTTTPPIPVSAPSHLPTTTTTTAPPTTSVASQSTPSQPQPSCAISGLCSAPIISGTYQFTSSNGQTFDLSIAPTSTKGVFSVTAPNGSATTMSVSGANFSFTNSSLVSAFPGGIQLVGLSEQNGVLVGHFVQNGVSTYSFTAKFVSSALFGRAPQVQIASIALSLPTPGKVFKSVKRDLFNIILAILLVLYISFTSEFFNAALGEKYEEFRRAMRRKLTSSNNRLYRQLHNLFFNSDVILPQSIWTVTVVLAIGATIGIFLDPNVGLNLATLYSWLAIAISVSLSPTISTITQNTYRKVNGLSSEFRLRAIPLGLFIALLAVGVSRFIHFKPGYLYGIVIGVIYYDKVKEHQEGHISTLNGTITLFVGLVAWLLWIPVHAYTLKQTGTTFISFIDDILASTFVSSIVGSLVTTLPFGALPGKSIFKWHKGAWLAFMSAVVFLLISVAATPLSSSAASNHDPLIAIIIAVLFLGGLAIILAKIFLRIEDKEEILEELEEEELVHRSHSELAESTDTSTDSTTGHE